jgi:hypothetical protein
MRADVIERAGRLGMRVRRGGLAVVSAVGAAVVSAVLPGVTGFGYGTIPALGLALDPGRGATARALRAARALSRLVRAPH